MNSEIETLCICGCSSRQHSKMNRKAWNRYHRQLESFGEDTPENRNQFWNEFLTGGMQDEWKCSECDCKAFKMDNLRYLEERLKEKGHG